MFLNQGLSQETANEIDLVDLFNKSRERYSRVYKSRGDWPCFFIKDGSTVCNTNDNPNDVLPLGVYNKSDWL